MQTTELERRLWFAEGKCCAYCISLHSRGRRPKAGAR